MGLLATNNAEWRTLVNNVSFNLHYRDFIIKYELKKEINEDLWLIK